MRRLSQLIAVFALLAFAVPALAQEEKKQCDAEKCETSKECDGKQCPIDTAMGKLPKMTFKVGDKSACCPTAAAEMAKESGKDITFVVAKKDYTDKKEAYTALVESTEKFVKNFATPHKCDVSGKTAIAGKSCNCPVEAGKRAETVKTAMASVKMSYKVGDKSCNCPLQAATLAKKSGDAKEFVVNKECTPCELTARLKLAHAKYKAAVTALAKNEVKTSTDK